MEPSKFFLSWKIYWKKGSWKHFSFYARQCKYFLACEKQICLLDWNLCFWDLHQNMPNGFNIFTSTFKRPPLLVFCTYLETPCIIKMMLIRKWIISNSSLSNFENYSFILRKWKQTKQNIEKGESVINNLVGEIADFSFS